MDNQTAYWLISAIIQSMAAIWAVFFGLVVALHEFLIKRQGMWSTKNIKVSISGEEKKILIAINITMPFSVIFGILSLIFFRNNFLIIVTLILTFTSIVLLMYYITNWIRNLISS